MLTLPKPLVIWDKLPDDFPITDDPVDNNLQPLLAETLREALELAGLISSDCLIATNFGINAVVEGKHIIKAPDWVYIPHVKDPRQTLRLSYAPNLDGDPPAIVMEFLSATEGTEYSINPYPRYGKWYFYEQILQVPVYVIFHPETGDLDVFRWQDGKYQKEMPNENHRYFLPEIGLSLGVWRGTKANLGDVHWLRWWDRAGNLLLWSVEKLGLVQENLDKEQRLRRRLEEKIKAVGIDPNNPLG